MNYIMYCHRIFSILYVNQKNLWSPLLRLRISGTLLLALFLLSCSPNERIRYAGLSLSFDDRSVKEWFQLRELLKVNNVVVTFFITQPDSLEKEEIKMLKYLEKDGHEIGFHGTRHVLSEYYIKEHSYSGYFENEINTGLIKMDSLGFKCESFAYPYGAKYYFTDFFLLRKFKILRGVEPLNENKGLSETEGIYYKFNGDRTVSAIGFDLNSGVTENMIKDALLRAKERKEILMLYAHAPTTEEKEGYYFNVKMLEYIIREAKILDINFYRMKDLP